MNKTDSVGNPLPQTVWLASPCSPEELSHGLAVNSFLLAVNVAIRKNHTVIYDAPMKMATITDDKGFQSIVTHP